MVYFDSFREKVGLKTVKALKRNNEAVTHAAVDMLCALMQVIFLRNFQQTFPLVWNSVFFTCQPFIEIRFSNDLFIWQKVKRSRWTIFKFDSQKMISEPQTGIEAATFWWPVRRSNHWVSSLKIVHLLQYIEALMFPKHQKVKRLMTAVTDLKEYSLRSKLSTF